jgi:hypothetical protein
MYQSKSIIQFLHYISLISFAIVCILPISAHSQKKHQYTISRWIDNEGKKPDTYMDYLKRVGKIQPFKIYKQYQSNNKYGKSFHIIINENLYLSIDTSLNKYISDLESEGYTVTTYITSGGEPDDLRDHLINQLALGMKGCVFIGDLPVAWYYLSSSGEQFPMDYYYMDLDGEWGDSDEDGILDSHSGTTEPEIWLGRLTASPLTYGGNSEAELVNRYLERVHQYRLRNITNSRKSLVYIDDDFVGDADEWYEDMKLIYHDVELVTETIQTNGDNYRASLVSGYEWIQVHVHSSPSGHSFSAPSQYNNWVASMEIPGIEPDALFYTLYACSNARYTYTDYMGGWYIFSPGNSLAALGSTKTGAMLHYGDFFAPLDQNACLGQGFKQWASQWMETNPYWFYGLTLLGDPTLTIQRDLAFSQYQVIDDNLNSSGNGNGLIDAGEQIELIVDLINNNIFDFNDVTAELSTNDPYTTIIDSIETFGNISAGQSASCNHEYNFLVSADCPNGHQVWFTLNIEDSEGCTWIDDFFVTVNAPVIYFASYQINDQDGNNNGIADPGETFQLTPDFTNCGFGDFVSGSISLTSDDSKVTSIQPDSIYPVTIQAGDTITSFPFTVTIASEIPVPAYIVTKLIAISADYSGDDSFTLFIGNGTGFVDNIEDGRNGWMHYRVTSGFKDEWHQSVECNHTTEGSISWKFGDDGDGPYSSNADGALEMCPVILAPSSNLSFWHRGEIEDNYDGGIVEINNGTGWQQITPTGGYSHTLTSGTTLNEGTPCFSGSFDWQNEHFDLSDFAGEVLIRFRFVSDGGLTLDGWYIDDIQVQGQPSAIIPAHENQLSQKFALDQNYPNPFNPTTIIKYNLRESSRISLKIYNLAGHEIETLINGFLSAGEHEITWQPKSLPSGIYFYRLQAGEFSETKKSILLK